MGRIMNLMNKLFRCGYAAMLLLPFLLFASVGHSFAASVPVLLTFDTQEQADAIAINALDLTQPATFFMSGQFVEEHGKLVQQLAQNHTIGANAYSYINLAELSQPELRKELLASKVLLQDAIGQPPVWFRAPMLSYNPQVMDALEELGFRYDSSDSERWAKPKQLLELPISISADGSSQLVSDYEVFEQLNMSDVDALAWFKARYQERTATGRPLVMMLHPRIIVEHKAILDEFIDYVIQQNGMFMSADGWLEKSQSIKPRQLGVWLNLALEQPEPDIMLADLREKGITEVYLMARDPEGNDYFVKQDDKLGGQHDLFGKYAQLLREAGIRVHAWLPVFRNSVLAQLHPEWAMVGDNGAVSLDWLSPSNPEVKDSITKTVKQLVSNYELDGIHLDYVRYPGLSHDYSPTALQTFATARALNSVTPAQLLSENYTAWTDWRAEQISQFVHDIKTALDSHAGIELSAALIADAGVTHQSREKFGQEYSQLAENLDVVMPMAYFKTERRPVEWIRQVTMAARYRVGDKQVFTGLASYQEPGKWTLSPKQFEKSIAQAQPGSDGLVFYPYLYLFSRGKDEGYNLAQGSAALLDGILPSTEVSLSTDDVDRTSVTFDAETTSTTSNLNYAWLTAAIAFVAVTLLFIMLRRWQARPVQGTQPSAPKRDQAGRRSSDYLLNWRQLSAETEQDLISHDTFMKVSALLRTTGAAKVASFRRARVLDIVSQRPKTLNEIVTEAGVHAHDARTLRYVEESNLLNYVALNGNTVSITEKGQQYLMRWNNSGYSKDCLSFLEARLKESLMLDCPYCGAHTLGHWFWENFQCIGCHRHLDVSESSAIHRKAEVESASIHSLFHEGDDDDRAISQ